MTGKLMNHLALEDLAAYIEGKLSSAERAAITAHLADCDECFQVFAEAVRIGQDEEGEVAAADPVPGGNPAPLPFDRRKVAFRWLPDARWWPAAAAAVLVLGVGAVVYRSLTAQPDVSNPQVVAALGKVPGLTEKMSHVPVTRGSGVTGGTSSAEAFQLGVLELDLEISLAAQDGKTATAAEICRQIGSILDNIPLLDKERDAFFGGQRELLSGQPSPNLGKRLFSALEEARQLSSTLYWNFGRWAEAGRLSAIAGGDAFFAKRDNRRFLAWLLEDPARLEAPDLRDDYPIVLPPEVVAKLERIAALWDDHAAKPKELSGAFETIVKYHFEVVPAQVPLEPE